LYLNSSKYLKGLRERDVAVLKEIYASTYPKILKHILANSGVREDAEDVFQEALIVLYRKIGQNQLNIERNFESFFFGVCRHIWLKKLSRKQKAFVPIEDNLTFGAWEEDLIEVEQYQLYRNKFNSLGGPCQKILQLFFDKKSMKEIAQIMGFASEGYAKKKKFKCQKHLIELIKKDSRYQELL